MKLIFFMLFFSFTVTFTCVKANDSDNDSEIEVSVDATDLALRKEPSKESSKLIVLHWNDKDKVIVLKKDIEKERKKWALVKYRIKADDQFKTLDDNKEHFIRGYVLQDGLNFDPKDSMEAAVNKIEKVNKSASQICYSNSSLTNKVHFNGISDSELARDQQFGKNTFENMRELITFNEKELKTLTKAQLERECLRRLNEFYESPKALWSNKKKEERIDLIYAHALRAYNKVLEDGKSELPEKANRSFSSRINPHYIDPAISAEALACIAYQETKPPGHFSPHELNYTFCQNIGERSLSTAYSLNMATQTTYKAATNQATYPDKPRVNLIPLTTLSSEASYVSKLEPNEQWKQMSDSVPMQFEVMLRILNMKIKENRKEGMDNQVALLEGIASYDRDRQGPYIRNVSSCLKNFKNGKSATETYYASFK